MAGRYNSYLVATGLTDDQIRASFRYVCTFKPWPGREASGKHLVLGTYTRTRDDG